MKDLTKRKAIRSKAITQAAYGEDCCMCGRNDNTTVACHLNEQWAGKGMGLKASDIAIFFGCSTCHKDYDVYARISDKQLMRAMYRTWVRLIEMGIIQIKGMK